MPTVSFEEVWFASGPHRLHGKLRLARPRAPIITLLHGLGFHSFEYEALAQLLAQSGLSSLAFDFRGHGRSEGPRGHWVLQDLVEDALNAVAMVSRRAEGPIGVFGNSLGAIVGVYLAARTTRVRSLVASGCPTRVADFAVNRWRRSLLSVLRAVARVVPIRVSVNHFIPYGRILLRPEITAQVRRDRLITDARRFAPATYADMFAWNALGAVSEVKVPLLVLYALHDGLQPPEQSTMLFEAAHGDKALRALDTGHVPNLENPEVVAAILVDWFGKTLAAPGVASCDDDRSPITQK